MSRSRGCVVATAFATLSVAVALVAPALAYDSELNQSVTDQSLLFIGPNGKLKFGCQGRA